MDEVTDALIEAEALIAANEAGALAPCAKRVTALSHSL